MAINCKKESPSTIASKFKLNVSERRTEKEGGTVGMTYLRRKSRKSETNKTLYP